MHRGLRVLGGSAFTPASLVDAVRLLEEGRVDTGVLRGEVFDLDHVEEAIDLLLRRTPGRDAVRVTIRHEH